MNIRYNEVKEHINNEIIIKPGTIIKITNERNKNLYKQLFKNVFFTGESNKYDNYNINNIVINNFNFIKGERGSILYCYDYVNCSICTNNSCGGKKYKILIDEEIKNSILLFKDENENIILKIES